MFCDTTHDQCLQQRSVCLPSFTSTVAFWKWTDKTKQLWRAHSMYGWLRRNLFLERVQCDCSCFLSAVGFWPSDWAREVPGETLRQRSSLCHWLPLRPEAFLCKRQPGPSQAYSKTQLHFKYLLSCLLTLRLLPENASLTLALICMSMDECASHLCAGSCSRPPCARSWRALRRLAEGGEAGSAEGSPPRVRDPGSPESLEGLCFYRSVHRLLKCFLSKC